MAAGAEALTILETCEISPPPNTVGERSLPLTFFDLGFLLFTPVHRIFFYELPYSKAHFIHTIVPNLKHSLSITLQHFFPFTSNLIVFPDLCLERKPEIRYVEGDSVTFTLAECTTDFDDLVGNHPRECDKFYPLVPPLGGGSKVSNFVSVPLFSVQVTIFPDIGISIGLTSHHALCDASTGFDFLKAWATKARSGTDELFLESGSLPFYDRAIEYPSILDETCLSRPGVLAFYSDYQPRQLVSQPDRVRGTLVLTRAHIDWLKKWISIQLPTLEYVSSFSVACGFVWSCLAKSRAHLGELNGEDELERFCVAVDWRARLDPPVPRTYFGNCVGPCFATTETTLLTGKKGFVTAAESLGNAIIETVKSKDGVIKDAVKWMATPFRKILTIAVAGTPKLKLYDLDFGGGKPKKYETISIDYSVSSISVNACRESPEDLEIGLSLQAKQMDAFITISRNELESVLSEKI